jgi:hypothetical protein
MSHATTSWLMTATLAYLGTTSSFLVGTVVLVTRTPKAQRQALFCPLCASLKDYDQVGRSEFMHLPVKSNQQLDPPAFLHKKVSRTSFVNGRVGCLSRVEDKQIRCFKQELSSPFSVFCFVLPTSAGIAKLETCRCPARAGSCFLSKREVDDR